MKKLLLLALFWGVVSASFSAELSPEKIRRVMDFYLSEREEIVVYQSRMCAFIHPSPDPEKQCEPLGENPYDRNRELFWQVFLFAPFGNTYSILTETLVDGKILESGTVSIEGSFLMVLPVKLKLERPGEWRIRLFHRSGSEDRPLIEKTFGVLP